MSLAICKLDIPNLIQSWEIGKNSDWGISDFWISGQFLTIKNGYNSRTSNDIDIRHRAITEFDKKIMETSKKIDDDAMLVNWDAIVIFFHFWLTQSNSEALFRMHGL